MENVLWAQTCYLEAIDNGVNICFVSFFVQKLTANYNETPLGYKFDHSVHQTVTSKLNVYIIKTCIFCSSVQVWEHSPNYCISHSFSCQIFHHFFPTTPAAFPESQFIIFRVQSYFHLCGQNVVERKNRVWKCLWISFQVRIEKIEIINFDEIRFFILKRSKEFQHCWMKIFRFGFLWCICGIGYLFVFLLLFQCKKKDISELWFNHKYKFSLFFWIGNKKGFQKKKPTQIAFILRNHILN